MIERGRRMGGSLNHIVNADTGKFMMDAIENLGDAHEALEECFQLIKAITGGNRDVVNEYCEGLGFPLIEHDMDG